MRLLTIGRLTVGIAKPFLWGFFDHSILDVKGFSFGYLYYGWWYDDIPEGLK